METNIGFRRTFAAAHRLNEYQGKCHNIHGHNYAVDITISGPVNSVGMVIDWGDVKPFIDIYDHAIILEYNDPIADVLADYTRIVKVGKPPTTEYLASMIADDIGDFLVGNPREKEFDKSYLVTVQLQETDSIVSVFSKRY